MDVILAVKYLTRKDLKQLGITDYIRDSLIVEPNSVTIDKHHLGRSYHYLVSDLMQSVIFRMHLIANGTALGQDGLEMLKEFQKNFARYQYADRYWLLMLRKPSFSQIEAKDLKKKVDDAKLTRVLLAKLISILNANKNLIELWQDFKPTEGQLFVVNQKLVNSSFACHYAKPLNQQLEQLFDQLSQHQTMTLPLTNFADYQIDPLIAPNYQTGMSDDELAILHHLRDFVIDKFDTLVVNYSKYTGSEFFLSEDDVTYLKQTQYDMDLIDGLVDTSVSSTAKDDSELLALTSSLDDDSDLDNKDNQFASVPDNDDLVDGSVDSDDDLTPNKLDDLDVPSLINVDHLDDGGDQDHE